MEVEEIADVTGTVALDEAERSASNATNLDTLRASARRIRIFAIAATVLVTSRKTVSRLVEGLLCPDVPWACRDQDRTTK